MDLVLSIEFNQRVKEIRLHNHWSISLPVVTILVANVYVYTLEKWLLRQSLLPCYKKAQNVKFTKRLEATTKILFCLPNSNLIRSISTIFNFARLGRVIMVGNK